MKVIRSCTLRQKIEYEQAKEFVVSRYNIMREFSDGETVIFNTLYDSILILSRNEKRLLDSLEKHRAADDFEKELFYQGIIVSKDQDEGEYIDELEGVLLQNCHRVPSITILPTQACNARCTYCFAEHNKKITMNNRTVEDVISFFADNFSKGDKVQIRWFGGEPLVGTDIIRKIIKGIKFEFDDGLEFESIIFSNGSLLTDALITEMDREWHVKKIQLTIDGYREEHNLRKNYIDKSIDYYQKTLNDIPKLLSREIAVNCRLNLDKDNIKDVDNILRDLSAFKDNRLFKVRLTILRPTDCGFTSFDYIKPNDYKWAYNLLYKKAFLYGFLKHVNEILPMRRRESCISRCQNKVIIGADGVLYKCLQKVFDENHKVGSLSKGIDNDLFVNNFCKKPMRKECNNCRYKPLCMGGCDAYWDLIDIVDITPCIREKYFFDLLMEFVHNWSKYNKLDPLM